MKHVSRFAYLTFSTASLAAASVAGMALASGHFISGLQGQYPEYDLNDTYVFQSSNDGYTTIISSAKTDLNDQQLQAFLDTGGAHGGSSGS